MMSRRQCQPGAPRARFLAAVLSLVFAACINAMAQNRMPPIPADKLTDAQKKAVAEFKTARGADISGPFVPLLRSPEVMSRARAMGDYLRYKSALPPRLSEFVILIVARHWSQQYEWSTHDAIALKAGVNAEIVKAIAEGRRPERMADDETILYDFCDELQRNQSVSDATYARAVSKFGEQGVIDTVGIVGYYSLLAMVLNTARTPVEAPTMILAPFPR
jgi:4-carboxymuconolactone decarboxylase